MTSSLPTSALPPPGSSHDAAVTDFDPKACLFCTDTFPADHSAKAHMRNQHGLLVPLEKHLTVDWVTLMKYLHLIIYDYYECIYCHTKRKSSQAILEHMTSQNHCQIDIDEGSEFRDFYDFDDSSGSEMMEHDEAEDDEAEDDEEIARQAFDDTPDHLQTGAVDGDATMRLPSGKIVASRKSGKLESYRQQRHHPDKATKGLRPEAGVASSPQPARSGLSEQAVMVSPDSDGSQLVDGSRNEKQFSAHRSTVRKSDQQALAHFPLAEQRVLLAVAQKHQDQAERVEKSIGGKLDVYGNIKVSERFVNDVPGGKAHKNRFFAR